MGAAAPCKQFLWQPSESLRLDGRLEEKLVRHDEWLEGVLRNLLGRLTWKTTSWSDLASKVDSDQRAFVRGLQANVDPESTQDVEITKVSLLVIHGQIIPEGLEATRRTGLMAWLPDMTSRMWQHLDHRGNPYGSTTRVNVDNDVRMVRPQLPSLEALGMEAQIQQIRDRDQASEDAYMIKLSHTYCMTHYSPPHGPVKWEGEMVLLKIGMAVTRHVVLQIDANERTEDGTALVTASNLGGVELESVRMNLDDTIIADLLSLLSQKCSQDAQKLRLVSPTGAVADWRSGSTRLASFLGFKESPSQETS